ncbi:MAG: methylamine utilization protein [Planctomycetota bacterium]
MSYAARFLRVALVCPLCLLLTSNAVAGAPEEDTATLRITFKWKGDPPKSKPAPVAGDFCGKHKHDDETFVVNPENKGVANIFVYVKAGRRTKLPKIESKPKLVELDNKNCRFEPHALLLRVGDTLRVKNSDDTGHNVKIDFFRNEQMSVMVPKDEPLEFEMTEAEPAVTRAECSIHPWMNARVLVLDHPFAAISNKDGVLEIAGLPVGQKLDFRANHESLTNKFDPIFINGKQASWSKNRFELTLKPGMNDLGTVELPWK